MTFRTAGLLGASLATLLAVSACIVEYGDEVGGLGVYREYPRDGYDRDLFGDYDRAALLEQNRADYPECDGYYSVADDVCHAEAEAVEVDHIVALAEAWDSGAAVWDPDRRKRFGSDPANLWLMTAGLNRSKSDLDPAEWKPPHRRSRCDYLERYVEVKIKWGLAVDEREVRALDNAIPRCGKGGWVWWAE